MRRRRDTLQVRIGQGFPRSIHQRRQLSPCPHVGFAAPAHLGQDRIAAQVDARGVGVGSELLQQRLGIGGIPVSGEAMQADIEIVMPLPSADVVALRATYERALDTMLREAQISEADLQAALEAVRVAVEVLGRIPRMLRELSDSEVSDSEVTAQVLGKSDRPSPARCRRYAVRARRRLRASARGRTRTRDRS